MRKEQVSAVSPPAEIQNPSDGDNEQNEAALMSAQTQSRKSLKNLDLATTFLQQERFTEAETLLLRVLPANENNFGAESIETADTVNLLAYCYWKEKQFSKAEHLFKRTLAIYKKEFQPDDRHILSSTIFLAALYDDAGRAEEAEPLLTGALATARRTVGVDDSFR